MRALDNNAHSVFLLCYHLIGKLVQALRAEFCLRMAAINLCGSGLVLLPVIAVVTVV